jgi:ATP-dependent DNA helicase RecG
MRPAEKDAVMRDFACGSTDILVSTTVIEVGISVRNATVMLVLNSERFGLSQLHQLRGRVGRGADKSYCILVTDSKSKQTRERMEIMTQTNDGFVIAETDLKLRGSGEFFGTRQSGMFVTKLANLSEDGGILKSAHAEAQLYIEGKQPLSKPLESELARFFGGEGTFSI